MALYFPACFGTLTGHAADPFRSARLCPPPTAHLRWPSRSGRSRANWHAGLRVATTSCSSSPPAAMAHGGPAPCAFRLARPA